MLEILILTPFLHVTKCVWGAYVDTVGKNKNKIAEYIRHQLDEDKLGDQLSIPFKEDPFKG